MIQGCAAPTHASSAGINADADAGGPVAAKISGRHARATANRGHQHDFDWHCSSHGMTYVVVASGQPHGLHLEGSSADKSPLRRR